MSIPDGRKAKRKEAKENHEKSNMDFLLDIFLLLPDRIRSEIGEPLGHKFDYNFSLLQTVIVIILIAFLAMGGLLIGLTIIT